MTSIWIKNLVNRFNSKSKFMVGALFLISFSALTLYEYLNGYALISINVPCGGGCVQQGLTPDGHPFTTCYAQGICAAAILWNFIIYNIFGSLVFAYLMTSIVLMRLNIIFKIILILLSIFLILIGMGYAGSPIFFYLAQTIK